jgi:flagellar biosynthesis/type III secretory pathway protein FliH
MSSYDPRRAPGAGARGGGAPAFEPLFDPEPPGDRAGAWRPLFEGESVPASAASPAGGPTTAAGEAPGDDGARAFAAGYELGRQETRAEVETVAESLVKSLEELAAFRARLRQRYERELLELALGVARKVVRDELRERPEIWATMIREAVRQAVDREEVRIRVPVALVVFLREQVPALRAQLEDVKELVIVEDPGLREGGCVIETRFGELDIGVDTQIAQVHRALERVG